MRSAQQSIYLRLEKRRERERERESEQLKKKEKEIQDGHKRRLSLRPEPFVRVEWVDLPPQRRRCSVTLDTMTPGMSGKGGKLQKS